ncbi:uncharacterized protein FPRO_15828 [Fusarium proliferatum ET1]|uniref:Uncharacterized protein n=1 Tax=Fusarium proliferatum (strain ET1) TaxID=1227346 RepID=A0A1L7WA31_FUSPR|nr:uncharacterized protein FPRO_15828 [Fusarium proliferatum ET1]CZR49468.1 uncharacterized protein FPRO_15828 [Fusarium proliferatum ET1]
MDMSASPHALYCRAGQILDAVELARIIVYGFEPGDALIDECFYYPAEWDTNDTVLMEDLRKFKRDGFKRLVESEIRAARDTDFKSKKKMEEELTQVQEKLKGLKSRREAYKLRYKAKGIRAQSTDHLEECTKDKDKCCEIREFHQRLVDWETEETRLANSADLLRTEIAGLGLDIANRAYILRVMREI